MLSTLVSVLSSSSSKSITLNQWSRLVISKLVNFRIPYTMAKFVVYEKVVEAVYRKVDKNTISDGAKTGINLGSGLIAGFAAALVSQPADTMLSVINKTQGAPGESTVSRLVKIAKDLGIRGSYAGIGTR